MSDLIIIIPCIIGLAISLAHFFLTPKWRTNNGKH